MNANDTTNNDAHTSQQQRQEETRSTHYNADAHAGPCCSPEPSPSPHSHRSEELEEGQVRIHVQPPQPPLVATDLEDREESAGVIRVPAFGFGEKDSSAEEQSAEDEDDREIDILLREGDEQAAAAPHILVAHAAASALPLPLLHINRPDENATEAPQSLWSLPLPPRSVQVATSAPTSTPLPHASSSSSDSDLRARLLALPLPARHVDLVLARHSGDAPTDVSAIGLWVERVMQSMYEDDQKKQQQPTQPSTAIASAASKPLLTASPVEPAPSVISLAAPVVPASAPLCGICFDPIVSSDPSLVSTACHHPFCAPCWNGFLATRVLEGIAVLSIRCPHADPAPCTRLLSSEEVKQRLTLPDLRVRYDRQCELARLAQDPSARWCPTPSCETVLRGGSQAQPHLQCERCRAELCFKCSERWHPRSTCAEASAASLAQLLSGSSGALSSSEELKRCPSCSMGIVRSAGCNFLRCSRCQFEFCWLCLGEYSDNHYAWWNLRGCPLLHLDRWSFLADDRCCGVRCSCGCGCAGVLKRTALRLMLALLYLVGFLIALPFLIIASPVLLVRYHRGADRRARRRELQQRNQEMAHTQRQQRTLQQADQQQPSAPAESNHVAPSAVP